MLLRAKDCTVPPNETFFTSVCTVKEFLRSLGNTSNINGVLDLLAEKRPQHTQFIESGLLSFTHFIYVVFTPTRDEMKQYFARGAAIFCKRNQKGADIILPVLLPPTTPVTKSSPYSFSYILISVKNYSSQSNEAKLAPSRTRAETVGIDIPENINYSHMTLFMDVGADLPPQLFSPTVGRQSERLDELARYKYPATISFQGISPEVYQFLRPPNNEPGGQPSTEIAQISSERQTNHSDLHDKLLQMSRVLVDPIDQVSAEDQNVYKSLMILTYSAQHDCFGGR
jgi:hypothetical protein